MRLIISFILMVTTLCSAYAVAPDIIMLQNGQSITAYNVEIVNGKVFYTLSENSKKDIKMLPCADIKVVSRISGEIIYSNMQQSAAPQYNGYQQAPGGSNQQVQGSYNQQAPSGYNPQPQYNRQYMPVVNPHAHPDQTVVANNPVKKNSKGEYSIVVPDLNGNDVRYRISDLQNRTLAITKPGKGMDYDKKSFILPEYIVIGNDVYTVTSVDPYAFHNIWGTNDIEYLRLPNTLIEIGEWAFNLNYQLIEIVIPDRVQTIGDSAFRGTGMNYNFKTLYISPNVSHIGSDAFRVVGPKTSFRGFYQGSLIGLPQWIDTGNCTNYGIDEEAVEEYRRKYGF